MNWISCKDDMPKLYETVLVIYNSHVRIAKYYGDHWDMGGGSNGYNLNNVSHWARPELPESVKREIEERERKHARERVAQTKAELEIAKREFERAQELARKYEDE